MAKRLLDAALSYLQLGWAIFPLHNPISTGCSCGQACSSPGKHPRTKNGVLDASKDPSQIREWWTRWPSANIGLATGEFSGVWVLDLDEPTALKNVEDVIGALPATLTCKTARGAHLYWGYHPGIKNRARLVPGVDVRGDGGYVVVPPSLHPSGVFYEWDCESPENALGAPLRLLSLVLHAVAEKRPSAPAPAPTRTTDPEGLTKYQRAALEKAGDAVRNAPQGMRNQTLNNEAYSLAGLGIDPRLIQDQLGGAAHIAGLTSREIEKTLKSGISKGEANPRVIDPLMPRSIPRDVQRSAPSRPTPEQELPAPLPGGPDTREALTDTGNAKRLVHLSEGKIRYCYQWGKWLTWTGTHWQEDEGGELQRRAEVAACSFFDDATQIVESAKDATAEDKEAAFKRADQWAKHARLALSAPRRGAMIELAQSERGVSVQHTELDQDPWLFNCANGTIDLRTGQLKEHRKEDLLSKCSPVPFDPTAEAPTFFAFLNQIMSGDQEMIACLQRAAGYSLTGLSQEHVVFFLHGGGSNGKGTLVETLLYVMGAYAYAAPSDLLLAKKGEAHPTEKASLFGRRLAACSELTDGRWDEKTLKELTGGDTISARRMREDFWCFKPTHKLWVSGNHRPRVRGTDNGIWRRLKLLPFNVQISEEQQDKALPEKLRAEASGILQWAVQGCLSWQRLGLAFPEAVKEATLRYRQAEDAIGRFVEDCCVVGPQFSALSQSLFSEYERWCSQEGEHPLSKHLFGERLEERGFAPTRIGKNRDRGRSGIGLRTQRTGADVDSAIVSA